MKLLEFFKDRKNVKTQLKRRPKYSPFYDEHPPIGSIGAHGDRKVTITVPDLCQRCHCYPADIMVRMHLKHTLEFICTKCRNEDSILRHVPIGPKV
jgi:hypothetical protein